MYVYIFLKKFREIVPNVDAPRILFFILFLILIPLYRFQITINLPSTLSLILAQARNLVRHNGSIYRIAEDIAE